jgi:ubiquinone/menaquinone biosynthesis C-methylase UbiE
MESETHSHQAGHVCPHELGFFLDNPIRRIFASPKRTVGRFINKGDTVVDLGCGPGFFTVDLACMVGENGRVIAVDLQTKMLETARAKAKRKKVEDRITFHQCSQNSFELDVKADFILAYYMIHETPDPNHSLVQIHSMLKENGRLLAVEPRFHVSQELFSKMLKSAEKAGFTVEEQKESISNWSVVLKKV